MSTRPTQTIIFVNRYFYPDHSATSQLLSDLAFDLASRGETIHVITGCQLYGDPQAALPAEESIRGVHVHRVRTSRFGRGQLLGRLVDYLTFYVGATWQLLRMIRPGDVVVAKTDPPLMSVCAGWVATFKRGVLVNWVQDLFPEVATSMHVRGVRFLGSALKSLRNQSLRLGRSNVVLGEIMAKRLREEGIPSDRIAIIENWADGEVIQPIEKKDNPLIREWRVEDKFILGYSGNMGQVHEFRTMIDAAERLKAVDTIAFVFVGDGMARPWLVSEVARRGLTNVQFHPYQAVDRLSWSLSVPDVHFVSLRPSLEGLIVPSKFYSVAAAGRPIIHIGDRHGEIASILEREQCGWSFCIGDVDALVACILRLAVSRHEAIEAGLRARQAFDERYSRSRALSSWRLLLASASTTVQPFPLPEVLQQPVAVGRE